MRYLPLVELCSGLVTLVIGLGLAVLHYPFIGIPLLMSGLFNIGHSWDRMLASAKPRLW